MPKLPTKQFKLAIIYWPTSSVGGIATHLNSLRQAALDVGDKCDILVSSNQKTKKPGLFGERKWIRGGDTNIWVDGEAPHHTNNVQETLNWLEANYDGVCFGFICPHETKAYPTPAFLPLYETKLTKVAFVMDGYWDDYSDWAVPLLPKLKAVLCPLDSYATPVKKLGFKNLVISAFPFDAKEITEPKTKEPYLIWPCQWKNIKGVTQFLEIVPELPPSVKVGLYSNGIRYYQLRTEEVWKKAVDKDLFKEGYDGKGRATFYGNVDIEEVARAYQQAWFTVNLQGMNTKKETYRKGSYNNTEVEALYYGACPILHSSTKQTGMPDDVYIAVDSAKEIPGKVREAIRSGFAISRDRMMRAKKFVVAKHLASNRYQDLRSQFANA